MPYLNQPNRILIYSKTFFKDYSFKNIIFQDKLNFLQFIYCYNYIQIMESDFIIKKQIFLRTRRQPFDKIYSIQQKKLGEGFSGSVYKVKEKNGINAPWRAAKIIQKGMIKNINQLLNEIHILKKLDHPNIIKIYQIFQSQTTIFIVQDFCEGGDLFQYMSLHGSFPQLEARKIFRQALEAIYYCHLNKISHRDIKPGNCLLLKKDSLDLKLIDFGLAFEWNQSMQLQLAQQGKHIVGTAHYIPPEIIQQEGQYDQRCDIWSLGIMLYVLLTGVPPFDGTNTLQIFQKISHQKYSLDISQMKTISNQAKDIIKKILVPQKQRISIQQILKHPWIVNEPKRLFLRLNPQNFKVYSNFAKMKKIVSSLIASQLPSLQVEQLTKLFQQIDANKNGQLCLQEMRKILIKEGLKPDQINKIMQAIDTDHDGKISYTQFLSSASGESIFAQQNIKRAFNILDINGNHLVEKEELVQLFTQSGIHAYQRKIVEDIISQCDKDGDGRIDFNEFQEFLRKKA